MSEMIAEVYRAFKQAGVSDDDAQAAAAALTGLRDEPWKRSIEKELASLRADMADIRGILRLHNWMFATNIALTVAVLFRLLSL
ncbi:MAG: hypothetical protein ACRERD_08345 [Candidatus Binatia bacterium]